eukprot:TRINITY_DN122377_c0_g1_i1.p1 TRINITY_DN122377_c0_g1~~TRINITY_DN122377_c0_g1_i1.p1  ORF type:complete len:728 (+),score=167.40 TRINITY_DN122377_c0_g1_i1:169-2352(+)
MAATCGLGVRRPLSSVEAYAVRQLGQVRGFKFGGRNQMHRPDPRIQHSRILDHKKNRPYEKEAQEVGPEALMQTRMYQPEMLSSDQLALSCHRMVLYGLSMPELLDRYAVRATEIAHTMKPIEFSLCLSAFAKAQYKNEEMLKAFGRNMMPKLPNFLPMQLSQTLNSFAKLRERNETLIRRFSAELPHKLPQFEGFQLKNVVNAYARLAIRDDLLFDDIADEVVSRPEDLCASDLILIANAYATFKVKHPKLWATLCEWMLRSYIDFRPVDIAVVLNALSTMDYRHDALLDTLVNYLVEPDILEEVPFTSLALIINALARLRWAGHRQEECLGSIAGRMVEVIETLDGVAVIQLLHACTKLKPLAEHEAFVEALLTRSRALVPTLNSQSLGLLTHCCGALRRKDVQLLTLVAKAVPPKVKDFTPQALALTAGGFAKLEVRSEILFYLLAGEILEKMPLFSGQGVGMVLRAFARLQINNEKIVQACKRQIRALSDELRLADLDAIESGLRDMKALDGHTEALIRRIRIKLAAEAETDAARAKPLDPAVSAVGAEAFDGLPERSPAAAEAPRTRASRHLAEVRSSDMAQPRGSQPPRQEESGERDQPDLWDLWTGDKFPDASPRDGRAAEPGAAGGVKHAATSPSQLRDFLTRPQRVAPTSPTMPVAGERPVVDLRSGSTMKASDPPEDSEVSAMGADGVDPDGGGPPAQDTPVGRGRKRSRHTGRSDL